MIHLHAELPLHIFIILVCNKYLMTISSLRGKEKSIIFNFMTKQIDAVYLKLYKRRTGQENQTSQVQEAATYLCLKRRWGEEKKHSKSWSIWTMKKTTHKQIRKEKSWPNQKRMALLIIDNLTHVSVCVPKYQGMGEWWGPSKLLSVCLLCGRSRSHSHYCYLRRGTKSRVCDFYNNHSHTYTYLPI